MDDELDQRVVPVVDQRKEKVKFKCPWCEHELRVETLLLRKILFLFFDCENCGGRSPRPNSPRPNRNSAIKPIACMRMKIEQHRQQ